ncbi:MAG: tRNA 2-thiouridine(34) synthase MnmA [Candidatus Spechtbacteria bacterium RIFCSPHIGHO2_02_FULL_43_15b]|uniref:tRNA-specific 2-thiouridylase MnmA n=1 Tax=Candidatus Spechtbacteria bacterium RIFCSPHIGHO2_01_FULL_43_30 TaxID=1802158 RepID=A0A1G2H7F1_9BACT|nr:MAG: tRNA 2-thiouridine(34) synthase MnmA [Candidatus Spechtbacteria bacterium RIFCSPHIGHO2_01_FULL_43_30]OGZ59418.1 MAG: tRNA 2-thiouridine(34) synthase MnmA [Candidatus Spechtbacteria bacterium RIFCSPHIGHO2_02_FULL_43_15b]
MSGGVDSSVSAALLKISGYDVTGVFMKCWSEEEMPTGVCTSEEDEQWARRAASKIGIPFYSIDFVGEYRQNVVDYFIEEYRQGRTPNPDVMCNREIKFGVFYDWAINSLGADYIATGHYARLVYGNGAKSSKSDSANPKLLKGIDPNKDQSYFLWAVDREKFKKVIFPVGEYMKSDVRKLAREFNLPNATRKDSQGICFIGKLEVSDFLKDFIPDKEGPIVNAKGKIVGEHKGLHYYTLGQRKGINIGGGPPYYVWGKDRKTNTLLVSREFDDKLFGKGAVCSNVNWISEKPSNFPYKCKVKIRYRQEDKNARIKGVNKDESINVEFGSGERAVTPGQSVVFYRGDELIGGGIIN